MIRCPSSLGFDFTPLVPRILGGGLSGTGRRDVEFEWGLVYCFVTLIFLPGIPLRFTPGRNLSGEPVGEARVNLCLGPDGVAHRSSG